MQLWREGRALVTEPVVAQPVVNPNAARRRRKKR
jgi:hypothetical protein